MTLMFLLRRHGPKVGCLLGITLLLWSQTARAQGRPSAETCTQRIDVELAREHRRFRMHVYGIVPADGAPVGAIRHDEDGAPWYKRYPGTWISADGQTITDDTMEAIAEFPPQKGYIETKGVLTSDFVPYFGQSLQAFQCHLEWVCNNAKQSTYQSVDDNENLILVEGCIQTEMPSFQECHILDSGEDRIDENDIHTTCDTTAYALLQEATRTLLAITEYDAAYRSFLQFAGNFDLFLQDFHWPLLTTLRQLLELSDQFRRIPCFLASCDASSFGSSNTLTPTTSLPSTQP